MTLFRMLKKVGLKIPMTFVSHMKSSIRKSRKKIGKLSSWHCPFDNLNLKSLNTIPWLLRIVVKNLPWASIYTIYTNTFPNKKYFENCTLSFVVRVTRVSLTIWKKNSKCHGHHTALGITQEKFYRKISRIDTNFFFPFHFSISYFMFGKDCPCRLWHIFMFSFSGVCFVYINSFVFVRFRK